MTNLEKTMKKIELMFWVRVIVLIAVIGWIEVFDGSWGGVVALLGIYLAEGLRKVEFLNAAVEEILLMVREEIRK